MTADRGFSVDLARHGATLTLVDAGSERYELAVDGIPQSMVSLGDPLDLRYPYVRWIARTIDAAGSPGAPLRVLHLGAGAMTLPRYVAATRPGSPQLVVEAEQALFEAVLAALPLPEGAEVHPLFGDARAVLGALPDHPALPADVAVIDLWDAATVSAHVSSLEFYELVLPALAPDAVVAVNLLDGGDFRYLREQAATLRSLFPSAAVVSDESLRTRAPLGNAVLFASNRPALMAHHRFREEDGGFVHLLHGERLDGWIGDTAPVTDATATDSPSPGDARLRRR